MDLLHRRRYQKECKKFDEEVDEGFKLTLSEVDQIRIEIEPNDVEITSTRRGFWEHDIVNLSEFDVVCRVRATNSKLFCIHKNAFHIKPKETFLLKISRVPHQIRSHHLKIDVTKYTESFNPSSLLDYFVGPYAYKTFIVRYHGAPRYWSDALEMNEWITGEQLDNQWETEMKKTSKEKKSSLETSEISSMNENQEEDDEVNTLLPANMNITNVMIMSNQVPDEVKKEDVQESESDDSSDLDETIEKEGAAGAQ